MHYNLIAIGRSRYLYNSIQHLASQGYSFKGIFTEQAYDEYDVSADDFHDLAKRLGAEIFTGKILSIDHIERLIKTHNIQAAISANWRFTIPKNILELFEVGILNFHLGNLPDYKGNATVNWSIINNEKHIHANIHKMDTELDAGDVITREAISITSDTYIGDIIVEAERIAPFLYESALKIVKENPRAYQIKGTVHGMRCYPRLPEDSQVNWDQCPESIYSVVRASSRPYKGAYSFMDGKKVVFWKAKPFLQSEQISAVPGHVVNYDVDSGSVLVACKGGVLELQEIECDGKRVPPTDLIKSIRVRFKHLPND